MPIRVIAKKRCRAMFEPPEKGERATLNSNLSTRLNLLFSDQALGRRIGYCWSRRASVPRLIFNAQTLKLCSKIKFATQAQQAALSASGVDGSIRPEGRIAPILSMKLPHARSGNAFTSTAAFSSQPEPLRKVPVTVIGPRQPL
jgi:hypothetical protein